MTPDKTNWREVIKEVILAFIALVIGIPALIIYLALFGGYI